MIVLGLDPGFANIGYGLVDITKTSVKVVGAGVFTTAASSKKRKVLATDDNLRRAREIAEWLDDLIAARYVRAICAESMSFPRNSSAAAKVAMTWGIIASLAYREELPIIQASPQEIKLALCGVKSASKVEVEEAVERLYTVKPFLEGTARGLHEHAYDAVAAIHTGINSDLIRALISFSGS